MAAKRKEKAKGKASSSAKAGAKASAGRSAPKKAAPTQAAGKSGAAKKGAARMGAVEKGAAKKGAEKKAPPPKKAAPPKKGPAAAEAKAAAKPSAKPAAPSKATAPAAPAKGAKKGSAAPAPPSKRSAPEASSSRRALEIPSAASAKGAKPAAPSQPQRGGILPPPKPSSSRRGEVLTLVPARSSQPGTPRPAAPSARGDVGRRPAASSASSGRGVTLVRRSSDRPSQGVQAPALPIPVRKLESPPTVEERFSRIEKRLEALDEPSRRIFYEMFDQAWVSHDSALEGNVYTREEILAGFSAEPILTDSSLQPAADEIRRHREAIEYVRDFGLRKRLPVTVDVVKKIYLILHPSEGDLKTVKYRRDVPQHRLYFHEYAAPDKIAYKVRQVVDWLNEPETKKTRNSLRIAARAHYDLVRVFPFQNDSGKVSRLFMNLLLYRSGYPPAIIHAKERQGYYEALKGEPNRILRIVQDAVEDGLASIEKFLDEQDAKKRPFVH
ncbi:MAG: Fic family protein [Polyangiaceae bacterium]|nr:Fic family protein [Polyangiaceae bacterium]